MIQSRDQCQEDCLITVIIVNYFSSNDLSLTLKSIKKNNCFPLLHVYVVDNSSDAVEKKKLQRLQQLEGFTLYENEKNIGFAKACNLVYQDTNSPFVLLINPDAYFKSEAIDNLLEELKKENKLAATGPKIFWDDKENFILPSSVTITPFSYFLANYPHTLFKKLLWLKSLWLRKKAIKHWTSNKPLLQNNLSGGSVLLKRSSVDGAGGLFDEHFFMYYEDTDLFLRLTKYGGKLLYVPHAHTVHKFSGCARDQQAQKDRYMGHSANYFLNKHYPKNFWIKVTRKALGKTTLPLWSPELIDLGLLQQASKITIPLEQGIKYLIEWSPSPYFLPAAGMFCTEKEFIFPQHIWNILPPGNQYIRAAPINNLWIAPRIWHWVKE